MKKLIDVAAVNQMISEGQKVVYQDANTLITPAARDAIKNNDMEIKEGCAPACEPTAAPTAQAAPAAAPAPAAPAAECTAPSANGEIDAEMIFKVLSKLQEKGLLNGLLDACAASGKPYVADYDKAGFKLVHGNTVKTETLDTGNPADNGKCQYQEIIGADDESSIAAGFITIDNINFDWETECQEIYYIIDGLITVTIDGKVYEAKAGDSFFIKKGIKCQFGAKGLGKAFYATY